MRQTRLTFTPVPSSSPIGTPEKRAAFARTEHSPTSSKISSKATSSASKPSSTLKISPVENMVLPTPAPSSQIGQKDEESSDSTQTESEIPVGSRIFGRYARRETGGSNTLPLSPQSRKESPPSKALTSSEAVIFDETLKRKADQRKPPFRKLRRRLSSSAGTVSSSSNEDEVKPSLFRRRKQSTSLDRMTSSASNEGSSEEIATPKQRKRRLTRNVPQPSETDPNSEISLNQVTDDLQEDLNDLRDSSKFYFEYAIALINFTHMQLLHYHRDINYPEHLFANSIL